ncbi:MAG: hypothetical protein JWP44_4367 [Mucilaginibacter sp.]|jgi:hypothetical protein|nr:hypothetical protein [Mucilaginibacter sp.]
MKDIKELRDQNFKMVFEMFKDMVWKETPTEHEHGMLRKFAAHLESSEAFLSHIKTGKKGLGTTAARNIEQKMKLPHGWMDQDHTPKTGVIEPANRSEAKYIELALSEFKKDPVGAMGALMTYMSERQKM